VIMVVFLWMKPLACHIPIDVFKEGVDVFGTIKTILGDVSVLENVHDEKRGSSGKMSFIMLVDPHIGKLLRMRILVEDDPANAAHKAGCNEFLLPLLVRAKLINDC